MIIVRPPFRGLEHKNKAIYSNDGQDRSDVATISTVRTQAIPISDMDKPRKAEFTKRPDGKPLVVARHYASGELLKYPVEIGDVRDLKIGEEMVYVEVINDLESGKFKGEIVSFDSSPEDDYRGHKTGDTVYFEEAHIWA